MIDYNREAAERLGEWAAIYASLVGIDAEWDVEQTHIQFAVRYATIAGHFGNLALGRHLWMVTDAAPLSPDGRYSA